jgi:hypothetical protein
MLTWAVGQCASDNYCAAENRTEPPDRRTSWPRKHCLSFGPKWPTRATKLLIAKSDQTWGERVIRTRDIVEVV